MGVNKQRQLAEGGIMKLAPIGNFLLIESGIVMLGGGLYSIVLGGEGLNNNLAALSAPPCPAGYLA